MSVSDTGPMLLTLRLTSTLVGISIYVIASKQNEIKHIPITKYKDTEIVN